jgi:RNase P subunit RPR2
MAIEFITTRELNPGKVKVVKLKEEPDALVEYTCPKCSFNERRKEAWQEPLVSGKGVNKKFLVKCGKCGHEIKFLRLKKEAKKKK